MKFAYTILYVEDVSATIAFYESAFGFTKKFITPEGDYGELLTGETTISFANLELANSNFTGGFLKGTSEQKPFGIELAFTTENIEADFAQAKNAGAVEVSPVKQKPWGQKVGYLRDNNGFLIEICTPMG
ncbi:MAG: VOC family protein [Bacteroidota bacterium]